MPIEQHECAPENARIFMTWIKTRNGLALWNSANLSNPSKTWTGPVNDKNGKPVEKPSWEANEIYRKITNPAEIVVIVPKELRRFKVTIRPGGGGFKCSDASSAKIRAACEKAGPASWYEFDYSTQEAIIFVPDKKMDLPDWLVANPPKFYECGICGHCHPIEWNGDCREDKNRFTHQQLDEIFGADKWEEVDMPV